MGIDNRPANPQPKGAVCNARFLDDTGKVVVCLRGAKSADGSTPPCMRDAVWTRGFMQMRDGTKCRRESDKIWTSGDHEV